MDVFFIENIWKKVSNSIKKKCDSETRIKSYGDETTNLHDEEMDKVGSNHIH